MKKSKIQHLQWLGQSPDLNLVEMQWHGLKIAATQYILKIQINGGIGKISFSFLLKSNGQTYGQIDVAAKKQLLNVRVHLII